MHHRRRTLAAAVALLVTTTLLAGCWDLREMNQLAMVMAVGIDKAAEPGRFEVSVQIARPGAMGKGQSGGSHSGAANEPVYTATADGDTIFAAIRNIAQFSSRRLMWAHNNVVVIGEELAREDITPVMDFFTRNQELRMRTWVVVAQGTTAREIVAAKTGMEEIPANSISALLRYAALPGESVKTDINEVVATFLSPDLNPVIPAMRISERVIPTGEKADEHGGAKQAELRGSAVFRRNKLVGFVQTDAGRGMLWLRHEMQNAVITIPCPKSNGNMAVEIRSPDIRLHGSVSGRIPVMTLKINTEGWLAEQDCIEPKMDALELKEYVRSALSAAIDREVRATLAAVQGEMNTDVIRYGRRLHIDAPQWWHANRERWPEVFPKVKTITEISVTIPKQSLFVRPMKGGTTGPTH